METHNIIKQKIDSINSLPSNYEPNLESKWELLEASLKPNKKKPFIFWFNRIGAVAAVFLLFGAIGMYGVKLLKPTDIKKPTTAQVYPVEKEKQAGKADLTRNLKNKILPVVAHQKVIAKQKKATITTELKSPLLTEKNPVDTPNTFMAVVEKKVEQTVKKLNRFTEIDFGETTVTKPLEIKVASTQNIKFKIGTILPNKTLTGTAADNSSFGFTKQIIPF